MGGRTPRARARASGKLIVWQSLLPGKGGYTMKKTTNRRARLPALSRQSGKGNPRGAHGDMARTEERQNGDFFI